MSALFERVQRFLAKHNFACEFRNHGHNDAREALLRYMAPSGRISVSIAVNEKLRWLSIYHYPSFSIPQSQISDAAVFLHAATVDLPIGHFELFSRIGIVRFHASIVLGRARLREEAIQILLGASLSAVTRHFPVLVKLISSDIALDEALASCQANKAMDSISWSEELPYERVELTRCSQATKTNTFIFSPSEQIH